jgi:hypothetical protein
VNAATPALVDRSYHEIVEDILTAIAGGVVNEPVFYHVEKDLYPLKRTAAEIRSVTGSRCPPGENRPVRWSFVQGVDFDYDPADGLAWLPAGSAPEDGTMFWVSYLPVDANSPLTDTKVGSVTRTLAEAIGRELAEVYQEINQAYLAGFVDTARGEALDLVVAILNVTRQTRDYAMGQVTFVRSPVGKGRAAHDGDTVIPAGTLLTTADGQKRFSTTEQHTLQRGQARVDVPVRAGPKWKGAAGITGPNTITVQVHPLAGIDHVTNVDATLLPGEDETDEKLRARAKAALHGLGKGTVAALRQAAVEHGAGAVEVWDPNGPAGRQTAAGSVTLLVDADALHYGKIRAAVQETRAAGVRAAVVAHFAYYRPRLVARVAAGLPPAGRAKAAQQIVDALDRYTRGLPAGAAAKGRDMIAAINRSAPETGQPEQVRFLDVMAWRSDAARPGPDALLDALVAAASGVAPGNGDALRKSLAAALADSVAEAPSGRHVPDRSLIRKAGSNVAATDVDIDSGEFEVVPDANGGRSLLVLDMSPDDVRLVDGG